MDDLQKRLMTEGLGAINQVNEILKNHIEKKNQMDMQIEKTLDYERESIHNFYMQILERRRDNLKDSSCQTDILDIQEVEEDVQIGSPDLDLMDVSGLSEEESSADEVSTESQVEESTETQEAGDQVGTQVPQIQLQKLPNYARQVNRVQVVSVERTQVTPVTRGVMAPPPKGTGTRNGPYYQMRPQNKYVQAEGPAKQIQLQKQVKSLTVDDLPEADARRVEQFDVDRDELSASEDDHER